MKTALSLGWEWLCYKESDQARTFTVHSVFDRLINISGDEKLLSITASGVGGSSSFLMLPDKVLDLGVKAGEICVLHAGRANLGRVFIDFSEAPIWKGPVDKFYRQKSIKNENIAAFKSVLDRLAHGESAWRTLNDDSAARFPGLKAIKKLRENPALARNLIGLGSGLTPSGDDMLLGFLAVVNHTCDDRAFVKRLRVLLSASTRRTVDIAEKMLANALECEYHETLQNSLRDLCEGTKEDIYISAASLIKLGSSSGSDIATGMYFGMIDHQNDG